MARGEAEDRDGRQVSRQRRSLYRKVAQPQWKCSEGIRAEPRLLQIISDKWASGVDHLLRRPVENQLAVVEHEEAGLGIELAFWQRHHLVLLRVEAVGRHGECVLQAMSY